VSVNHAFNFQNGAIPVPPRNWGLGTKMELGYAPRDTAVPRDQANTASVSVCAD